MDRGRGPTNTRLPSSARFHRDCDAARKSAVDGALLWEKFCGPDIRSEGGRAPADASYFSVLNAGSDGPWAACRKERSAPPASQ